jgi:hypothetical protein
VSLFTLAGLYGRFDSLRVADQTTHAIVMTLRVQTLDAMEKNKKSEFVELAKTTLTSAEGLKDICKEVVRLGPPNYYPNYMIQRVADVAGAAKSGEGLVQNFDAAEAWKNTLDVYLRCSGA